MIHRSLPLVAIGILLSGCAAYPGVYAGVAAQAPPPIGYHYHDGTHPNDVGQTSPQAMLQCGARNVAVAARHVRVAELKAPSLTQVRIPVGRDRF